MKLLIVDDDSSLCSALARNLIRLGHAARSAASVTLALKLVESESPAAVLTDLDLGAGGDGIDLITRLRQQGCQVPAILMTGSDPVIARARLGRAGLDEIALLEKPFAFEDLAKVLAEILPQDASLQSGPPVRQTRPTPVAVMLNAVGRAFGGRGL
jgi:two-component system, OmpR family, response regulator